jgi:hypothetical protein
LLFEVRRPRLDVGRIVAYVVLHVVVVDLDNFLDRTVQKIAVVGHHDDGPRIGL